VLDPNGLQLATFMGMRFEGNALAGTYRNDWVVPCNAKPGNYRAEAMALDAAKNSTGWIFVG